MRVLGFPAADLGFATTGPVVSLAASYFGAQLGQGAGPPASDDDLVAAVLGILFQHGVADERVPFTQALELYTALSRRGVVTRLAAYPRSGHDITEPDLLRDLMVRNLDWFTRFVPPTVPQPRPAMAKADPS